MKMKNYFSCYQQIVNNNFNTENDVINEDKVMNI